MTAVVPTADAQTLLVASLDARLRLLDRADGVYWRIGGPVVDPV